MTHDRPSDGIREVDGGVRLTAGAALHRWQTGDDQRFGAIVTASSDSVAGIEVRTDDTHRYTVTIVSGVAGRVARLHRQADDLVVVADTPLPGDGPVRLSLEARPGSYTFTAAVDGVALPLGSGSARLLSAESAEWFVAAHIGVLCREGVATFTDLDHEDLDPLPTEFRLPF